MANRSLVKKVWAYSRKHGWKRTAGQCFHRLGHRYDPPPAPHVHVPVFPSEIATALAGRGRIEDQIAATKRMNDAWARSPRKPRSILWFIPDFLNVHNGGPNTIMRFAHELAKQGIDNTLLIVNGHVHQNSEQIKQEISSVFGHNPRLHVMFNHYTTPIDPDRLPESDVSVATIWHSAYMMLPYKRTKAKFYFVQDNERMFYPAGVEYGLANMTYDFGYYHIFNTPGLGDAVSKDHDLRGRSFTPGIDHDVFFPDPEPQDENFKRIFFYGRPDVPRNGFTLGVAGLQMIKREFPDTEIFIAGHHANYPNLGLDAKLLPYMSYRETGAMYRSCGSVLGFMFTPHPSYIPLQAMSCGAIPIAVRDPHTQWALNDGHNARTVDPIPREILEAYAELRHCPEMRARLRQNAIDTFAGVHWTDEIDRILGWICTGCPERAAPRLAPHSLRAA